MIAAGGIADGRGLVAALALGAVGVLLGTRFVATREASVPEFQKKALLEAEAEATTMTDAITGLWARYLRNTYTTRVRRLRRARSSPPSCSRARPRTSSATRPSRPIPSGFRCRRARAWGSFTTCRAPARSSSGSMREARAVLDRLPALGALRASAEPPPP